MTMGVPHFHFNVHLYSLLEASVRALWWVSRCPRLGLRLLTRRHQTLLQGSLHQGSLS